MLVSSEQKDCFEIGLAWAWAFDWLKLEGLRVLSARERVFVIDSSICYCSIEVATMRFGKVSTQVLVRECAALSQMV